MTTRLIHFKISGSAAAFDLSAGENYTMQ